ncbi:MAG: hypothetical protein OXE59_07080 [Bacteroidetes bacterium]|nr:hypothetical protein [Bacteroidota bacterium]MCY4233484.1 hypothetical protein [Bacteroidota bacterium]
MTGHLHSPLTAKTSEEIRFGYLFIWQASELDIPFDGMDLV